jgi:hypothetical protein
MADEHRTRSVLLTFVLEEQPPGRRLDAERSVEATRHADIDQPFGFAAGCELRAAVVEEGEVGAEIVEGLVVRSPLLEGERPRRPGL